MAQTKELIFKKYWEESISLLWQAIDRGWSVTSCTYNYSKEQFTVKLSEKGWPEITLECCGCKTEFLPKELLFRPSPSKQYYCITCDATVRIAKADQPPMVTE